MVLDATMGEPATGTVGESRRRLTEKSPAKRFKGAPTGSPWDELLRGDDPTSREAWKVNDQDDDSLTVFVKQCLSKLSARERESLADTLDFVDGVLLVGSACSGSEIARVTFEEIGRLLKCRVRSSFTCEKEPWKREWIQHVVEPFVADEGACCFGDIETLGGRRAKCERHGRLCEVQSCFAFSAGFSCKSLSKLNTQRRSMTACLQQEIGSSGRTFCGLREYLRSHRPRVLVLENVEELISAGDGGNYTTLMQVLADLDYDAMAMTLKSSDFVSPQRRVRAYVVAFWMHQTSASPRLAVNAARLVKRFAHPAQDLVDNFALDDTCEYISVELTRRLGLRARTKSSDGDCMTDGDGVGWKTKYAKILQSQGVAMSSCIIPKQARSTEWISTLTERCQVVLGHALHKSPAASFVDCYQSLQREFVSANACECSTIVPGSLIWSSRLSRPLLGPELLHVQGLPRALVQRAVARGMSDSSMADLAGNSFTAYVFASVAIAALVFAPTWRPSTTTADIVASIFDIV